MCAETDKNPGFSAAGRKGWRDSAEYFAGSLYAVYDYVNVIHARNDCWNLSNLYSVMLCYVPASCHFYTVDVYQFICFRISFYFQFYIHPCNGVYHAFDDVIFIYTVIIIRYFIECVILCR